MSTPLAEARAIPSQWIATGRRDPARAVLIVALVAALAWVYGAMVVGMLRYATTNPLWYHCLAVPFAAGWIWLRKRDAIARAPVKPWWGGGLALLALAFLLRLAEVGEGSFLFGSVSLILAVAGMVGVLGGRERLWRSAFAIVFLVFAIPVPKAVFGFFAFPMQNLSAAWTAAVCNLMGLPVVREGVLMALGSFQVTVATACSGMNSVFALFMCGTWIIGFARVAWYHRVWMLASIVPVVIVGNVLRLVVMFVVALFFGGDAALGFFHEGSDLLIFLLLASFLLWAKLRLECGRHSSAPPPAPEAA